MRRLEHSLTSVGRRLATSSALALGLFLSPGCALFGGPEEPQFKTVAVVTQGESDVDLEARSTLKSALVGGAGGVVGGAAVGAGPGAVFGAAMGGSAAGIGAVPGAFVGAGIFGGIGAAAGGTLGIVIGGLEGLPAEKAERVTQILAGLAQNRNFQEELRRSVRAAVPANRRATLDRADARAIVQLTELELEQHLKDEVSLRLRAKMTLEWGPDREDPHSRSHKYEYETPNRHVDDWLSENGAAFGPSLTDCIDTIAFQMSRDILSPEPR